MRVVGGPDEGQRRRKMRGIGVSSRLRLIDSAPAVTGVVCCWTYVFPWPGHVYSIDFPARYQNWETTDPASLFAAETLKSEANPKVTPLSDARVGF